MKQGKKIRTKTWNQFLKTLEENRGLIRATCEKIDISHSSFYKKRREDKGFKKKVGDIISRIERLPTAFVKNKLREAIFKGEGWAIKFYLRRKDKKWLTQERK